MLHATELRVLFWVHKSSDLKADDVIITRGLLKAPPSGISLNNLITGTWERVAEYPIDLSTTYCLSLPSHCHSTCRCSLIDRVLCSPQSDEISQLSSGVTSGTPSYTAATWRRTYSHTWQFFAAPTVPFVPAPLWPSAGAGPPRLRPRLRSSQRCFVACSHESEPMQPCSSDAFSLTTCSFNAQVWFCCYL